MLETSSLQPEPVTVPDRSPGRTARSVAGYAVLLALMFISPLFVFVPAAIFYCGLRNGRGAAVMALAGATIVAALIAVQTSRVPGTTHAEAMSSYAYIIALVLAVALPAVAVAPGVERGAPFGHVLLTAIVISIAGLGTTEVGMRLASGFSPYHEQIERARVTSGQFVAAYQKMGMPSDAVGVLRKWMDVGISCLPAFLLIDVIVVFVLSLVMFGRVKAWREVVTREVGAEPARKPVTPPYLFRNLSLPDWLLFAFIAGGITPLVSGMLQKVAANVLAVVIFLYLLQGLAIFRSLLVAVGAGFAGVLFGYLLLAFLTVTGVAPLLLSIAGLFDSFFDFRHFRRKDHSDESHPD